MYIEVALFYLFSFLNNFNILVNSIFLYFKLFKFWTYCLSLYFRYHVTFNDKLYFILNHFNHIT